MQKIQKRDLKGLQTRLSNKRDRLIKVVERHLQECNDAGGYRLPDVIDAASIASTEQLGILVAAAEIRELREIDAALARIESGRYGSCRYCGGTIHKDRLKALPYATLCLKCKEQQEEEFELNSRTSGREDQWATDSGSYKAGDEETEGRKRNRAGNIEVGESSHN